MLIALCVKRKPPDQAPKLDASGQIVKRTAQDSQLHNAIGVNSVLIYRNSPRGVFMLFTDKMRMNRNSRNRQANVDDSWCFNNL